jgi:hypothetical protein
VLEKVRAFFIYQPVRLLFMIWLQKRDLLTFIMSPAPFINCSRAL